MVFAGVNYFSIIVAAIAGFAFGALYYMTLAKPWMAAIGLTKAKIQKNGTHTLYFISFLANLLMAWVLAGVLGHLGPGQVTIQNGIISAAFIWFGFVITTMAVNNGFGMRKPMLTVIDAGHWLGVLLIMGGIIGAFGV
jgi:Protein of unknown function (DUF1761)